MRPWCGRAAQQTFGTQILIDFGPVAGHGLLERGHLIQIGFADTLLSHHLDVHADAVEALAGNVLQRLAVEGGVVGADGEGAAFCRSEYEKFGAIVRAANITMN